jgi:DNA-binding transcriptional regulator YhcF (GntR family)
MQIVNSLKKSGTPKYKQIVASIEKAIVNGFLKKGDQLPSLNKIKNEHKLSRDTVLTAFNELKNRGIIHSVVGKGYFVSTENIAVSQKIFLLFDELNSFKEDLYNSFLQNLGDNIQVDIFFHHFNNTVFHNLIDNNIDNYNYYVIMPANLTGTEKAIQKLPLNRVYILDQMHKELEQYPAIYQNFEKDIYEGLSSILVKIKNYKKLILVFSDEKQPQGILKGFLAFCSQHNVHSKVIASLKNRNLEKGEVYLVLDDKDLIRVIKKIREEQLELSKNIGIVSINETILKKVVAEGITTISTNFKLMGERLASMIINKEIIKIENPSQLILRKSI